LKFSALYRIFAVACRYSIGNRKICNFLAAPPTFFNLRRRWT